MIYLLTAIGLSPGGSSTVHIYTQKIHRTIQNKQYIEQHNKWMSAESIVQGKNIVKCKNDKRNINRGREDKRNLKFSEMLVHCHFSCT